RALRLSAVRAQPAAQLVCGLQSRARRRPLGAEARRPRLLQRARPRRAVRRPRPLHPRAAQRHDGADLLACRMGRELLGRPPSSAGVGRVLWPNALRGAFAMDRPTLFPLVERLRALEKLPAFPAALPARARGSEPALPVLLAGLHEELERPLLVLLPEDADARDAAEAAAWLIGEDRVAFLPSRGVRWGSGLEPPPHLVGERARALEL